MKRAQDVRKQLIAIMDRYKLDLVSAGKNYVRVCKAIASGFFFHAARKDPQEVRRVLRPCVAGVCACARACTYVGAAVSRAAAKRSQPASCARVRASALNAPMRVHT
jgi:hypothetical protein